MNFQPKNSSNIVFCFGEVLWDIFPNESRAGGAPFNVAYNLRKMGIDSRAISRVGNDDLGITLQKQLQKWGFPNGYLQTDQNEKTGTVIAHIDQYNEANYDIAYPAAYDFIESTPGLQDEISGSAALVFGSLIARHETSRKVLFELLDSPTLKIFDINLREPYCDFKTIKALLHKADIVKMNKDEMKRVLAYIGKTYTSEHDAVRFIQDQFKLNEILISKGSKGALYYDGHMDNFAPAVPVEVADTVGSGDAFLAGFISKRIIHAKPEDIMNRAVSLGAYITSRKGACPEYQFSDFESFSGIETFEAISIG